MGAADVAQIKKKVYRKLFPMWHWTKLDCLDHELILVYMLIDFYITQTIWGIHSSCRWQMWSNGHVYDADEGIPVVWTDI